MMCQCWKCTACGNIQECENTTCDMHENWYVRKLKAEIAKLRGETDSQRRMARLGEFLFTSISAVGQSGVDADTQSDKAIDSYILVWEQMRLDNERLQIEVSCKDARIDELQAIVDKLPKTADGVVLIPDHFVTLYAIWEDAIVEITGVTPENYGDEWWVDDNLFETPVAKAYSTREAAEAAMHGPCCPTCGGPADNGTSREIPPAVYECTKCDAKRRDA